MDKRQNVRRLCRGTLAGALGLLALGPAAARGAIIDITASTNAFVLRSAATTEQSEAQTLQTKRLNDSNTRISYLRFELPTGLDENDITSATLRLTYVTNSAPGTGVTQDVVRVMGLLDSVATEGTWTSTITWNTQPARSAAPNDISNVSSALPNANTTAVLGTSAAYPVSATPPPASVIDTTLNLAAFQSFVANDNNDEVTLLFHNLNNVIVSFASLSNTGGHVVPTLRLDIVPEPASLGLVALAGVFLLRSSRKRLPHFQD